MEELIPIAFFFSVAAVMILRPLTKRLGNLVEVLARERQARLAGDTAQAAASGQEDPHWARATRVLEHVNRRLDLLEERMDFVEKLADSRDRDRQRLSGVAG